MDVARIQLITKYIINFDIVCKTGLHIGGNSGNSGIGDIDNPVLKDPATGYPYICGSSLKGRMRERLEWLLGSIETQVQEAKKDIEKEREEQSSGEEISPGDLTESETKKLREKVLGIKQCKCGKCDVCHYFGHSNNSTDDDDLILGPTRFVFRDAMPRRDEHYDQIQVWENALGGKIYTEVKFENTISRLTAVANPRHMERIPAGSVFSGEIIVDLYQMPSGKQDNPTDAFRILIQGMMAIEQSFLGGKGSRGSGKVEFKNLKVQKIPLSYFLNLEGEISKFDFDPGFNAQMHWENDSIAIIN